MNSLRPITARSVLASLDNSAVSALDTDPYTLKILAEAPQGIERLSQLNFVNHLIACGVGLRQLYGQTESGGLMAPSSDTKDGWNWLVPMPHVEPYIRFEKVDEDLYHLVVLPGLRTKRLTNHPRKWKFAARHDVIIVLLNGEKADSTPLEQAVGGSEYVHVAVVFGAGRTSLGMLVVPSTKATGLSRTELDERITPHLDLGNARVPDYAKVSMDSLIFKEVGAKVPMTSKATVIRPQLIAQYASDIDRFYDDRESAQNSFAMDIPDDLVPTVVRRIVCTTLGVPGDGDESITNCDDLFAVGMDSLLASHVRVRLLREISLGGRLLQNNVAFDHPSIDQLSQHILDVRHGCGEGDTMPVEDLARGLVQKYTSKLNPICTSGVLLTGATGTIGRFILHSLLIRKDVERVYCLVRATSNETAIQRVRKALDDACLTELDSSQLEKITALSSNIGSAGLGLSTWVYETLRASVTAIIHNAWAVNYNMHLASFENPSIASVLHLLNLARQSTLGSKPTFAFISSTATVLNAHTAPVAEIRHGWDAVDKMGYAQSKWVAEEICTRSALHFGPNDTLLAAVDICGEAVVQLSLSLDQPSPFLSVFHVSSKEGLRWNADFLPALQDGGLKFEQLPQQNWLRRLERSDPDLQRNPPYRLLEHFRQRYGSVPIKGNPDYSLDITNAWAWASALGGSVRIDNLLIRKFVKYWTDIAWKDLRVQNP
ncbi:male sterility protein-domain-containing protein [Aspergillus stella-maris]|uniref:male sterility protein-domain-containing protein n=1 Tax=Aspergillus stella-maris TaxID=1810926 RepID=UPI003CCDFA18